MFRGHVTSRRRCRVFIHAPQNSASDYEGGIFELRVHFARVRAQSTLSRRNLFLCRRALLPEEAQRKWDFIWACGAPGDDAFQFQCVVLDSHDVDEFGFDNLLVSSHGTLYGLWALAGSGRQARRFRNPSP